MQNLASREYDSSFDKKVLEELKIAKIPVLNIGIRESREVKTNYIGILNGFVFERAWTYWVVTGYMPLDYANTIYLKFAKNNVRAGGHAGNVPPKEVATIGLEAEEEIEVLMQKRKNKEITMEEMTKEYHLLEEKYPVYVSTYHIDDLLGLCNLVEFIKENNITTAFKSV